jgi:hypothetical protein
MQLGWLRQEFRQKVNHISRPISYYFRHLHLGKEHNLARPAIQPNHTRTLVLH